MAGKKIFIHFRVSLGRDMRQNKEQNEVAIWPFQAKGLSYKSGIIDLEACHVLIVINMDFSLICLMFIIYNDHEKKDGNEAIIHSFIETLKTCVDSLSSFL